MLSGVNVNHNWKGSVENGAFLYRVGFKEWPPIVHEKWVF